MLPTALTASMLAVLVGLGVWQLQRLAWKEGLIARIEARTQAPAVSLDQAVAVVRAGEDIEYQRVRIDAAEAAFDHAHEQYVVASGREGPGWHVLTPLVARLTSGEVIWLLVNRGYVPARLKDPSRRAEGQIGGLRADGGADPPGALSSLVGKLRLAEVPGPFSPPGEPAKSVWYWRDLEGMSRAIPAAVAGEHRLGFSLELEREPTPPGGWPEGGVTLLDLPNRHLEYALIWFSLALVLLAVYGVYLRRWLAPRHPD